jgi:hypothetical protein
MNTSLLAVLGAALTLIIGVFKYFTDKEREVKEEKRKANELLEEGINEKDTSKITAAIARINGLRK